MHAFACSAHIFNACDNAKGMTILTVKFAVIVKRYHCISMLSPTDNIAKELSKLAIRINQKYVVIGSDALQKMLILQEQNDDSFSQ